VDEILKCDHLNESWLAVHSYGTVHKFVMFFFSKGKFKKLAQIFVAFWQSYLKSNSWLPLAIGMKSVSHGKQESMNSSYLWWKQRIYFLISKFHLTRKSVSLKVKSNVCFFYFTWTRLSAILADSLARMLTEIYTQRKLDRTNTHSTPNLLKAAISCKVQHFAKVMQRMFDKVISFLTRNFAKIWSTFLGNFASTEHQHN